MRLLLAEDDLVIEPATPSTSAPGRRTGRRDRRPGRGARNLRPSGRARPSARLTPARGGRDAGNPVKLTDRPTIKKTETRIQFLDQPELEKLLAAPYPDDPFGRIEPKLYLTAAMTGLRQDELIGLRWRDVDFAAPQDPGRGPIPPRRVRRSEVGRL
jgi:integrase